MLPWSIKVCVQLPAFSPLHETRSNLIRGLVRVSVDTVTTLRFIVRIKKGMETTWPCKERGKGNVSVYVGRERKRHRERDRQTDRQTERKKERETEREKRYNKSCCLCTTDLSRISPVPCVPSRAGDSNQLAAVSRLNPTQLFQSQELFQVSRQG